MSHIGEWATRYLPPDHKPLKGRFYDPRTTRSHLIESEIADRYVTRCGREMKMTTSEGSLTFSEKLIVPCVAGCVRK